MAAQLGPGLHNVEVTGRHPKLGLVRIQIPLSVVSPIDVRVPPLTAITLTDDVNGGVVEVELHNRSGSEQFVRVDVEAAPAGWMAVRLGQPSYVLKPNKSRRLKVQVERMVIVGDSDDPLTFGLRVSMPSGAARDVVSTFQVAVKKRCSKAKSN